MTESALKHKKKPNNANKLKIKISYLDLFFIESHFQPGKHHLRRLKNNNNGLIIVHYIKILI